MRRLIIRPGAIGDCILALPAFECLRARYTEIWVSSRNVPLVRGFDAVCPIARTGLNLLGIPSVEPPPTLIAWLRGFDSIVSWYGANREEFRSAVAALSLPFSFLDPLPPEGSQVYAGDYFLAQARTLSNRGFESPPRIECPPWNGGFAVIHPFSGSARKNWPLANYQRAAELLKPHLPVRWCAGPSEELAEATRFQNLYELACWLAGAQVYIGNDSGITHLAAAVGTPVVALFGSTDPGVWAPRGESVQVLRFEDATPESVASAALSGSRFRSG